MPISNATTTRGGDSNASMAGQVYEARMSDPYRAGKEVTLTKSQNAGSAANNFEGRVTPAETGTH